MSAVCAATDIDGEAAAVVRHIAANAPTSVARIKQLVRGAERAGLEDHIALEGRSQLEALRSDEFSARLQTFLEKRGSKASE